MSPVVAAIILIAVTVAVSIAVAAWMGALTFTFMKTEELRIVGVDFNVAPRTIDIHVRNSGTATAVITDAKVGDAILAIPAGEITLAPGDSAEILAVVYPWVNGTAYNVALVTKMGNQYTYRATSPPT